MKPARRRRRMVLLAVAGLLAAIMVALLTGYPQRKGTEFIASRVLGATVRIQGLSIIPNFRAARLAVYDSQEHFEANDATVLLEGLDVAYTLFPGEGGHIPELIVEKLDVSVRETDEDASNIRFIKRWLTQAEDAPPRQDSKETAHRFIPRRIVVASLDVDVALPQMGFRFANVSIESEFAPANAANVLIEAGSLEGSWWSAKPEEPIEVQNGTLLLDAERRLTDSGSETRARLWLDASELATINGAFFFGVQGEKQTLQAELSEFVLRDWSLQDIDPTLLPYPVSFAEVSAPSFSLTGTISPSGFTLTPSNISLNMKELQVGNPEAPLLDGDYQLQTRIPEDNPSLIEIDATLNSGQRVHGQIDGQSAPFKGRLRLSEWSHDQLLDTIPAQYRSTLEAMPDLSSASADLSFSYEAQRFTSDVTIDAPLATGPILKVSLSGNGSMKSNERLFEGAGAITLDGEEIGVETAISEGRDVAARFKLNTISADRWVSALTENEMLGELRSTVSGKIQAHIPADGEIRLEPEVTLDETRYGDLALPPNSPVSVTGPITYAIETQQIRGESLRATIDAENHVSITDLAYSFENRAGSANVQGALGVAMLTALANDDDVWGDISFAGPVSLTESAIEAEPRLQSTALGYGNVLITYGAPITASSSIRLDLDNQTGTARNVSAAFGDGARATSNSIEFALEPMKLSGPIDVRTDLQAFIEMGYLDSGTGVGAVKGNFDYSEEGLAGDIAWTLEATSMVLSQALAGLGGVRSEGTITLDEPMRGSGSLAIAEVAAAGTLLRDIVSNISVEGDLLRATNIRGTLFGGAFNGAANIRWQDDGLPVHLMAFFDDLDLAAFTRDFQPPETNLTGLATGRATLGVRGGELTALDASLYSEEGFSVNRALLAKAIQSQSVGGFIGAGRVERIIQEVLGIENQRFFDRAALSVGLKGERIAGTAVLSSPTLDLTIDLRVDPPVIHNALKLQQQAQWDYVEKIGTEPVE